MPIYGRENQPPQIFPPEVSVFIARCHLYPKEEQIPLGKADDLIQFGHGVHGSYGLCSKLDDAKKLISEEIAEEKMFLTDRAKRAAEEQLAKSTQAPVVQGNVFHGAN